MDPKRIKPLGIRMKEHLQAGDIHLDKINDEDIYDIPPLELSFPCVNLLLTSKPKSETLESDYRQRFLEINDSYENNHFATIYTDGSKSNDYVSASVMSSVDIFKVNLPTESSVPSSHGQVLCEILSGSNMAVRSYSLDKDFGYECTLTLALEI